MSSIYIYIRPIILAISVGMGWLGLFVTDCLAQAQKIDCAVASDIAGRAYDRATAAAKARDYNLAMPSKDAFWDIEEYSSNCQNVQKLAKALKDHGLGKEDKSPPNPNPTPKLRGSSSIAETGSGTANANSTVASIEMVPRPNNNEGTGAGTVAGAAVGSSGAAGASRNGADTAFRITLRMDDGSTRIVTQDTTPDFRSGDRVNLTGGIITH